MVTRMLECPLNLAGEQPSLICARIYRHNRASVLIASEISVCSGDKDLSRERAIVRSEFASRSPLASRALFYVLVLSRTALMRVREFGAGIGSIIRFNYSTLPSLAGSRSRRRYHAFRLTRKVLIEAFSIGAALPPIANDVKFHDSLIYIREQCIDNAP